LGYSNVFSVTRLEAGKDSYSLTFYTVYYNSGRIIPGRKELEDCWEKRD
jgi:hypothetical protein